MSVVAAIAAESDFVGIRPTPLSQSEPPPGRKRRRVSRAKVRANRRNARRSTGPRTAAGRARARMNAPAHGTYCGELLLPGEDAALLDEQRRQFVAAWAPGDACELLLVEQMLSAAWRLRRVGATENALHRWAARTAWDRLRVTSEEELPEDPPGPRPLGEGLWHCLQDPDAGGRQLEALGRAEQRLLGTVLRCSRELRQLKLLRMREGRERGVGGEEREEGEPAGAGDAADRSNAVDATGAAVAPLAAMRGGRAPVCDAASGETAPAVPTRPAAPASIAPAPAPQPGSWPSLAAENPAVGSFRTAGGTESTAVPLFEPADPSPREAAWCGAPPIPLRSNQR